MPLSGSQKKCYCDEGKLFPDSQRKIILCRFFLLSPSLSFLPHHVAIVVNENIMVPPIRSRNTGHLSIKVNNVMTFTVTDFCNKVTHNKVKKGSNFLRKGERCSRRKEQLLRTTLSPGNFSDISHLTTEAVKVKLKR